MSLLYLLTARSAFYNIFFETKRSGVLYRFAANWRRKENLKFTRRSLDAFFLVNIQNNIKLLFFVSPFLSTYTQSNRTTTPPPHIPFHTQKHRKFFRAGEARGVLRSQSVFRNQG